MLLGREEKKVKYKHLVGFKYPKILLLVVSAVLAYFLFSNPSVAGFISNLNKLSYLGIFIAGIFLAFGFTTPFAVGFFITLNPENLWLALIIGALGSAFGDLLIFRFIKMSFMDEFNRLEHTKIIRETSKLMEKEVGHKIKIYLMYIFAEFIILSPLPDEAGITLLAGLTKIHQGFLTLSSFILHLIGLLILFNI